MEVFFDRLAEGQQLALDTDGNVVQEVLSPEEAHARAAKRQRIADGAVKAKEAAASTRATRRPDPIDYYCPVATRRRARATRLRARATRRRACLADELTRRVPGWSILPM